MFHHSLKDLIFHIASGAVMPIKPREFANGLARSFHQPDAQAPAWFLCLQNAALGVEIMEAAGKVVGIVCKVERFIQSAADLTT